MPEQLQLLDRILGEIRQRLDASRAAYEESRRLEAALVALGSGDPPATTSPPARSRRSPRHRSGPRAPRGENLRRIRDALAQRPGATAGEISSATGIARATVASTLGKLARDGELEKTDLPSGRVGYRPAEPAPEAGAPDSQQASPDDQPGE